MGAAKIGGNLLRRAWILLVIVIVLSLAFACIDKIRSFSAAKDVSATGGGKNEVVLFNPKKVLYEVFGDAGGGGTLNWADITTTKPNQVDITSLPWSRTETTLLTTASASLTAQVEGGQVGCRITVNGVVRDEQTATHPSAAVFCNVTSA